MIISIITTIITMIISSSSSSSSSSSGNIIIIVIIITIICITVRLFVQICVLGGTPLSWHERERAGGPGVQHAGEAANDCSAAGGETQTWTTSLYAVVCLIYRCVCD